MNKERIEQIAEKAMSHAVCAGEPHFVEDAIKEAVNEALEEACQVVYGQCDNDNVAQRTVNAIRRLKV